MRLPRAENHTESACLPKGPSRTGNRRENRALQWGHVVVDVTADSLKAALDIDWDDDEAQRIGLNKLLDEVTSLEAWVRRRAKTESSKEPLKGALEQLRLLVGHDIEADLDGGGSRITEGTAKDRVISLGDPEMGLVPLSVEIRSGDQWNF